jgi:hypothetical protein
MFRVFKIPLFTAALLVFCVLLIVVIQKQTPSSVTRAANAGEFSYSTAIESKRAGYRVIQIHSDDTYFLQNSQNYTGNLSVVGCNNSDPTLGSCQTWKAHDPWKSISGTPYIMNNGVLKLTLSSDPRSYHIKIAPVGSTTYSSELVVQVVPKLQVRSASSPIQLQSASPQDNTPIRIQEYFNAVPGNTFTYAIKTLNHTTMSFDECSSVMQYETARTVCNDPVISSRYWKKSTRDCYWGPKRDESMRFLMVDNTKNNSFPGYTWVMGDLRYQWDGTKPEALGPFKYRYTFMSTNKQSVPAYVYGPAVLNTPTWEWETDQMCGVTTSDESPSPVYCAKYGSLKVDQCPGPLSRWKIRIARSTVTTPLYTGPAVQITQWESSFDKKAVLREDWYLVKGFGHVKITQKRFGEIWRARGFTKAPDWDKDNDYYNDQVQSPDMIATMSKMETGKFDYR